MSRFRQTVARALLLVIAISGTTMLRAQSQAVPASVMAAAPAEVTEANTVRLLVGRSSVVDIGAAVSRVSLTSPDVADALVTSPSQLLINGKMPGTISMFVWDRAGALRRYEIIVQRDLARLSEQVRQLFPTENIDVSSNGKNIVLSGSVSNKDVIERAVNVAAGYTDKREEVVTLLQLQSGAPSNQVLLRVRFAEVSRSAMSDLGASLYTGASGYKGVMARTTTEQYGNNPVFDNSDPTQPKLVFSDFLNLFLFDTKNQLGTVIKALQQKGQFQSLAEPNLVAESGKEASFLAGGEYPVPVATGTGGNVSISVSYKEYGIRLTFTPIVNGDRIHLKVKPEVSTLDWGNAVVLSGFKIPALSTRRTETELELQNHQTFAIAGLMDNTVSSTMQKIPGIGDIPILGLLFKSKAAQKNQTELVVMITPEILPNNSPGVTPNLPRTPEQFMPKPSDKQTIPAPAPAFSAVPSPQPAVAAKQDAPIPTGSVQTVQLSPAAKSAAAVANLPNARRFEGLSSSAPVAPLPAVPASPAATTASSASTSAAAPTATTSTATSSSASASASASTATPEGTTKPLSDKDRKSLEKSQRAEEEKVEKAARDQAKVEARAKAEEEKRVAQQTEINRRAAEKEQGRQAQLAKEQAKRDAEAAKKADDAAKRQSQLDRDSHKSLDDKAAKLKAAAAEYNAELAKSQQQQ